MLNKLYYGFRWVYLLGYNLYVRYNIRNLPKINLIIGSGSTHYRGWVSTDKSLLDVTVTDSWRSLFGSNKVDKLLAEHVFEHLDMDSTIGAIDNASKFLKKGGSFRIAVPDGNHPSKYVIDLVRPNGLDDGSDDHKQLFNIDLVKKIIDSNKFELIPLEYFDKYGKFHKSNYDFNNGYISRCSINYVGRFTTSRKEYLKMVRTTKTKLRYQYTKYHISYTSLLFDLIKK